MIEKVLGQEMQYIFVAKPQSHKYLYEELGKYSFNPSGTKLKN